MAEALQLGMDVIATAYGGNTDLCSRPLAHPVRGWPRVGEGGGWLWPPITKRQRPIPAGILRCWRPICSGFRGRPLGRAIGRDWKRCGGGDRSWRGC